MSCSGFVQNGVAENFLRIAILNGERVLMTKLDVHCGFFPGGSLFFSFYPDGSPVLIYAPGWRVAMETSYSRLQTLTIKLFHC